MCEANALPLTPQQTAIGQINESERTDRQNTPFKWAMSVLAAHDTPADQKNSVKRQRSLEETSPTIQPVPKKSRPAVKTYSDMVKGPCEADRLFGSTIC